MKENIPKITFDENTSKKEDQRIWWKRLLSSLMVSITPGKTLKQPIKEVIIKGGFDF